MKVYILMWSLLSYGKNIFKRFQENAYAFVTVCKQLRGFCRSLYLKKSCPWQVQWLCEEHAN